MKLKLQLIVLFTTLSLGLFAQNKMTKSELDASKIIQLGNSVIDLSNSYSQTLKNYQNMLGRVRNNMERINRNPNMPVQAVNCNIVSVQSSQQTAYTTALKTAPAFEEKAGIEKHTLEGEKNIESTGKWCAILNNYISGEEFKGDRDLAKYNEINDSLMVYIKKSSISWSIAADLASNAGNKAELILLEGSPIASFVIPMKKDLIGLDAVFNMLKVENPDANAIKWELDVLTKSVAINKNIKTKDVSKLRDIYYKEVYETFYRNYSSIVASLNTVADRLQEKEPDMNNINSWLSSASGDYRKTIESYNTFVSQ